MHEQKAANSELLMATNFFVSILVVATVTVSLSAPDSIVGRHGVGLNPGVPDSGGAGNLAGLSVMIANPLLVILGSIGYGVLSIAAWMRAREALPRLSIALAWIDFFIIAVATSNAVSTGKTVPQCAAFAALAATALTVCLSLRVSRRLVAPPGQPN
jgi:hypothetical protein